MLRRHRQFGVDSRGERVDQLRPLRVVQPEPAAASTAEVPLAAAGLDTAVGLFDPRVVHRNRFAPADLQATGVAAQIDGVAATALGLATDRAITALIRIRLGAVQTEAYRATMAGTFKLHGDFSPRSYPYQITPQAERAPPPPSGSGVSAWLSPPAWIISARPSISSSFLMRGASTG